MKDSNSVVEANLSYAVRIVNSKFATAEQAARTCGVDIADLRRRLAGGEAPRSMAQTRMFQNFDR